MDIVSKDGQKDHTVDIYTATNGNTIVAQGLSQTDVLIKTIVSQFFSSANVLITKTTVDLYYENYGLFQQLD